MLKKKKRSNIVYGLLALFFSLLLFFNANGSNFRNSIASTETYEETAQNVPITIDYDSDKYYIQGYESTANITLSGANRVQLNAEANDETRNFKVVADLTDLGEGTHDVPLKVENLSNSVDASLDPDTITVTIEKRVSKNFQIDTQELEDKVQDGFELEDFVISPQEVKVTSGEKTMKEISKVILSSNLETINKDISDSFSLQAVDDNGDGLSASIEPQEADVQLSVSAPDKEVSLEPTQTGEAADGVSSFDFQLSENSATISGAQNLLDNVDSLEVPVDVTDVTEPTTRNVNVQTPAQLNSDVDTVTVNITPIFEETSTEDSNPSSSTNSSSSTDEQTNESNENSEVEETETQSTDPTRSPPAEDEGSTTQESREQTELTQDSADEQVDAQENEEETER
ncbi:CdaR family protein [Tetragenococcus solitarius]|uniref:CdaR family protein n=1 Tax=Tetragenococcus solitarius TaxID=71453 RepID=A0ABN3XYG5_9ENTE|nr:CdaR family protein [Tetragenococcus solitarius]